VHSSQGRTARLRDRVVFALIAAALLLPLGYMLVRALSGADLVDVIPGADAASGLVGDRYEVLPWLIVASAAGLAALGAWWIDRLRTERATALAEQARRLAAELSQRDGQLARAKDELGREREQRAQSEQELSRERESHLATDAARRIEREWNRQLRSEVMALHRDGGVLGDADDVTDLVLRIGMKLLDADRGLLLSRRRDSDGDLELVAARGFDSDPEGNPLVQRFASEVIEHDTIVREDKNELAQQGEPSAAEEIENLIAIPIYIEDEFSGVMVCVDSDSFDEHDEEILLSLGDHAGAILENASLHGQLRTSYVATVATLAEAVRAKDPFLGGHSQEVSGYVGRVAERLGLERKAREELIFGSLLHDVGKIGISERILLKPDRLTPEEYGVIKLHPRIGYRIVERVPALESIALAILHHHERYDGTGYPAGLRGEEIPLEARVICVVDAFSAMTSDRPYRGRMSLEEACAELERCAGSQFDPEVVRIFVEEVRSDPIESDGDLVAEALDDPELQLRRSGDEPVLGYGSVELTDSLTLLYSHRYFNERVQAEAERATVQGEPFAVVMALLVDIDEINRREGYAAGDAAIQRVGRAVQRVAVHCGGTAARFSGRTLALLVPDGDAAQAELLADQLRGELGDDAPTARVSVAAWEPGDTGHDVIGRVRGALAVV
jgi:diguanylate cyclase (GGDEF)-like protein